MLKKTDVKLLGVVTAGVVLAGFLMNQFADVAVVANARDGFR